MKILKISSYSLGSDEPEKVIRIPLKVLSVAVRMLPKQMVEDLCGKGIDPLPILEIAKSDEVEGVLVEYEDRSGGKKIVVEKLG